MSKTPMPLYAANPELKVVTGKFNTVAGTATLTTVGQGFSVEKASTGTYTVTFDDPQHTLVNFSCHLQRPSVDDSRAIAGPYTAATATAAATQTIYIVGEDGTPAVEDPTDDADSNVHLMAVMAMYTTMV